MSHRAPVCPECKGPMHIKEKRLVCRKCGKSVFPTTKYRPPGSGVIAGPCYSRGYLWMVKRNPRFV